METKQLIKQNQPLLLVGLHKCPNCQADLITPAIASRVTPGPVPSLDEIEIPYRPGSTICPFCSRGPK